MQETPRQAALKIWNAAVDAVRADQLVKHHVKVVNDQLAIGSSLIPLAAFDRLIIVGAGKAATGMVRGLWEALPDSFCDDKHVTGWINVPENCVEDIPGMTVHAARPVGINEPTEATVAGSKQILKLLREAGPRDICICLISGGGSALLACPVDGVSLEEKVQLIRLLSESGANIQQLNTVRKRLSLVKGGALARQFSGQQMFTLIISDVIGDPLDLVASGPTVADQGDSQQALAILAEFDPDRSLVAESIYHVLEQQQEQSQADFPTSVENQLIGNLKVAVDAASAEAERLGFEIRASVAQDFEGAAEEIGRKLAHDLFEYQSSSSQPVCFISGGEPTVKLAPAEIRGKGGRNQQLVLAALTVALTKFSDPSELKPFCVLSAGTDGEDGPTDAAGAFIDEQILGRARDQQLDALEFLSRNDAYHFFEQLGGLIKTGATHTNVCDVRVAVRF